jgi:membrane protein
MIENASAKPKTGIVSIVLGALTLLIGAGGVVGQLQTSLNKIWGVEPKSDQGIWVFIRQRFISFAMVLAVGFLLLVFSCCDRAINRLFAICGELDRRR